MELREFAQQVLFATTLEDKLRRPEVITDDHPGPSLRAPEHPGRPAELRFKPAGGGTRDFPGLHQLEQEQERGRLLHFFANHELLATELMALVLLRFPEAPQAFRRGVLTTLQEEQAHTRLYLRRMAQCGLQFGELPVSGYFWRAVSPMAQPLDFVAGLSLTFEQANLDFCREFSRGFATVGDTSTAELLDGIYRDEIAHVAHGLKWFRRWKHPEKTDWEAFCGQLKFPLSPQRAKGTTLNVEGRKAAGLDPDFIAELDVFSQSKGRTPHVYWFNPFAEGVIARGRSFAPVKHQVALALDLATLPQFLGRQDDVVLVPRRPTASFLSGLKRAGFPLPEFVELKGGTDPSRRFPELAQRKLGALRPWAWGPDSLELLGPLLARVKGEIRAAEEHFNASRACLYSKAWSAEFLREILAAEAAGTLNPWEPSNRPPQTLTAWLNPAEVIGVAVDTFPAALDVISDFRARGHHRLVAKESVGLAGRNALRLWEPEVLPAQRRWLAAAAERGTPLVIEPWLERVRDFSVQWERQSDGLRLRGFTGLLNDQRGQYLGNWVEPQSRRVPVAVASAFPSAVVNQWTRLFAGIGSCLESRLRTSGFRGPIGLDAFIYRNPDGGLRLKPVVEINPRYTMGRVTLELMRNVHPGGYGRFRLVNLAQLRAEGFADFPAFAADLTARWPLQVSGEPTVRIREGALCLTDPTQARVCLAVFEVRRSPFAQVSLDKEIVRSS